MLTQNDFAALLLRGQAVQQKATADLLTKEKSGCVPDWSWVVCLSHKLQGLVFSLLISDFDSVDGINSYNAVLQLVQGQYGIPTTDPNAQTGGTVITITTGGSTQPNPPATEVLYSDTNWNVGHTVYTNTSWAGFNPQIYINGQRFLQTGIEFTTLSTGGFTLASPMIDGDVLYIIF